MHNLSLVAFTLLIQSAVGVLWISLIHSWMALSGKNIFNHMILFSVGLALTGLLVALFHLGNPKNSPLALSNIAHSKLSREIASVQSFAIGVVAIFLISQWDTNIYFQVGWQIITFFLGMWSIWAISQVYLLKAVPVWNHWGTPLDFLGTALLMGGIITRLFQLTMMDGYQDRLIHHSIFILAGGTCKIISLIFFVKINSSLLEEACYFSDRKKINDGRRNGLWRLSVYVSGVLLCLLMTTLSEGLSSPAYFAMFFIGTAGVEVWNRLCFYRIFYRVGI